MGTDGPWAVRSSATGEDGQTASWAGQFATVLDVETTDGVRDAIEAVLASAEGASAEAYRSRIEGADTTEMAVIVQRMVRPVASGVAFSRNPTTGLNEVILEAVSGRGDALVGAGVTPERWIERWGGWAERPDDSNVLPEAVVRQIAEQTREIAEQFREPVDVEWVWDGDQVWWVQVRPITGLEEIGVYSNRISREVMPGMIKPLIWSVNVPVVNRAWIRLFTEFIGPNDLRPEDLASSFAYRSYFNMKAIGDIFEALGMPRDGLEMLLGLPSDTKPSFRPGLATLRHVPRMLAASVRLLRYGRRVQRDVDELRERFAAIGSEDLATIDDRALLGRVDEVARVTTDAAYANIVTPLLANAWTGLFRRTVGRHVEDTDELDLDLTDPDNPFDPNPSLTHLRAEIETIDGLADELAEQGPEALPPELREEFAELLERFGALSDSGNDFSVPSWNEQPGHVLALALDHVNVEGSRSPTPWRDAMVGTGVFRRWLVGRLHRSARTYVAHREAVSFTYTAGYGMLRPHYLEVGRRLVERGSLTNPDDVMFLTAGEARDALLAGTPGIADIASARKADMARLTDVRMPETIFGDDFVPVPHSEGDVDQLHGVPTSRGWHRGTLRVVMGIADGPKVAPGDVIAVPFSDVGWTPIFARAGAVIAESGGMLSHSSIVAREYRVPCVVQVDGATRLPDGATVVVDGYTGTITVEASPEAT
ncbi:MAG: hypothetical protein HKN46_02970 [Acidimicrobiia bacterium]|nr:hypothetical protein [Acidimicrobiia bacterium]